MKARPEGLSAGLPNYGDLDFSRYLRRSFARSLGYSTELLAKPVVGIASSGGDFNNCHRMMPELVQAVKRGVLAAGGLPMEFPTISLGEVFLSPTSFVYRNLMAMTVEEMIRAQPMDAVVLIGGCDKTVPAQLMGAVSAGKPFIQLVTGPMMTGRHKGERLGACTDCRRYWADFRGGRVDATEMSQVEASLAVTAGTCAVMGTASTMACIAEALGASLPGTAAIPAVHADRLRAAEASGKEAVRLALAGDQPPLVTEASVENALRVLLALGGSTNAIIHLTAIARRAGVAVSLKRLNELSDTTPVLVDLKPTGSNYMEDFHAAGGLGALMREIKDLLNLETPTVEGETLGARLETLGWIDHEIIRRRGNPVSPVGGLVALFGNLAPNGAILKRAAADSRLFEQQGRAVVFENLEDLASRVDTPDLDVTPDDVLVLKNAGPIAAGMPEAGYLPIPSKLARVGVKDMIRISDARMSGTAFGTIVLHISPESAVGGPLALVETGDLIALSVENRRIDLLVSDDVLESRRRKKADMTPALPDRGYRRLYQEQVTQAEDGCDFRFLSGGWR